MGIRPYLLLAFASGVSRGRNIMTFARRQFVELLGAVIALSALTLSDDSAWSQTTRAIKIVVPFPAGGPSDIVARLLAEQIGRAQGPTIVVENRPGAATEIGAESVSRAAPDGNTLLLATGALLFTPQMRTVKYHPLTGFEPICRLTASPTLILVNGASPYRTLAELFAAARAKPGELTWASFGPASLEQTTFEMFKRATKINMTFVPYPGYSSAINVLLGEHVTSALADYSSSAEQIKAGKLRPVAAASSTRIEMLPDVPTAAEFGYKDLEVNLWVGLFAPAKTPNETVSQLAGWFAAAVQAPETKTKLSVQYLYPAVSCGADFGAFLHEQYDELGRAIREANIKAE
jgi:tripartite-type tricarboxylate transporter receptor subunit TctC